jgi:hypothetical protein
MKFRDPDHTKMDYFTYLAMVTVFGVTFLILYCVIRLF